MIHKWLYLLSINRFLLFDAAKITTTTTTTTKKGIENLKTRYDISYFKDFISEVLRQSFNSAILLSIDYLL